MAARFTEMLTDGSTKGDAVTQIGSIGRFRIEGARSIGGLMFAKRRSRNTRCLERIIVGLPQGSNLRSQLLPALRFLPGVQRSRRLAIEAMNVAVAVLPNLQSS